MKFYKVTCVVVHDQYRQPPWYRSSDRFYRAFGSSVFVFPDNDNVHIPRVDPGSPNWEDLARAHGGVPLVEDEASLVAFPVFAAVRDVRYPLDRLEQHIVEACIAWGVTADVRVASVTETTFSACLDFNYRIASSFSRIFSHFTGSHELCVLMQETSFVMEEALDDPSQETIAAALGRRSPYRRSLQEELARIAGTSAEASFSQQPASHAEKAGAYMAGHDRAVGSGAPFLPAHYILNGTNAHQYKPAIDMLASALRKAGRVPSKSSLTVDLDKMVGAKLHTESTSYLLSCVNDALVESLEGMLLIVRYGGFDEGGSFDSDAYGFLTRLLDALNAHPHAVQTILVVPENNDLKQRIRSRMQTPWVELTREAAPDVHCLSPEQLLEQLEERAADERVASDAELVALARERLEDASFSSADALFEEWRRRKLTREQFPAYEPVVRESLERLSTKGESALARLDELIGLGGVKQHIHDVLLRVQMNRELARADLPVRPFSLHMAFLGAPGTGKTEVARLYAEILREQHVLGEGRLIMRSGAESFDVDTAFEEARGSVLFIDEAYGLPSCFTSIESLIANMENHRDEVVVILAGYENEMEQLFRTNPGFRSRVGFCLHFPDYSDAEKLEIFQLMARRAQLTVPDSTLERVRDLLARGGKRDDEGNARFVRKLFEDACGRQQIRLARKMPAGGYTEESLRLLAPEDVGTVAARPAKSARDELDELIGLAPVKQLVSARIDLMKTQKARRDTGLATRFIPLHLAFKGNPGTGKTEVARLIGRILKEEGVLSVGDFYECGRQDLVAGFVGGTSPKIEALFRRAKGSVIFIDEAYALNDGQHDGYGEEVITAIIDQMEKLREDVVVIFAGYTREIDELFKANPGFASRVRTHVEFPDYTADELVDVLHLMARKQGLTLGVGAAERAREVFDRAIKQPNFGNARFARNLLEEALVAQGVRLAREAARRNTSVSGLSADALTTLAADDFRWEGSATTNTRHPIGFLAA